MEVGSTVANWWRARIVLQMQASEDGSWLRMQEDANDCAVDSKEREGSEGSLLDQAVEKTIKHLC